MTELSAGLAPAPTAPTRTPASLGRILARGTASWLAIIATALSMTTVALLTGFSARSFNREVLARAGARAVLRIWGIKLDVRCPYKLARTQAVYISNHISSLDVVIIIALGLPNTRYFMKGYVRRYIPVGIIAMLMGTFFTMGQDYPGRRRRLFQHADRVLRQTGESVFLTPEGKITLGGEIGPFNKGAFHLATSLRAPIVPFYIQIPPHCDPRDGFVVPASGTVRVWFQEPIATHDWRLEEMERNRDEVRAMFVRLHRSLRQLA
jgi:1-acyl-sn-glycerol-3-phosphate acyltransferase